MATTKFDQLEEIELSDLEASERLTADVRNSARDMPRRNARYLVDTFYQMQKFRVRTSNQSKAAKRLGEAHDLLEWSYERFFKLERQLGTCLDQFAKAYVVGNWMQSICGIAKIMSAGLLAEIDITKAPTCGHIWRFAGLDPSLEWLGRDRARDLVNKFVTGKKVNENEFQAICKAVNRHAENIRKQVDKGVMSKENVIAAISKRPYSTPLKTLCAGKLGPSFVKVQNNPKDFYGGLYRKYKDDLVAKNIAGEFAETAKLRVTTVGKSTDAYKAYSAGLLPPAHIDRRAIRWVVKLFLSHLHQVMFEDYHKKKGPIPYAFDKLEGHEHFIAPPNWPGDYPGKSLTELR